MFFVVPAVILVCEIICYYRRKRSDLKRSCIAIIFKVYLQFESIAFTVQHLQDQQQIEKQQSLHLFAFILIAFLVYLQNAA